ncbi:MAG: hypothetical protein WA426_16200, partial [Silvibacterium sp.]
YWSTQQPDNTRIVKLGDQNTIDAAKQTAATAPPSLRNPGEPLPADKDANTPQMQPVQFPKDTNGSQPGTGQQSTTQQTPAQQTPQQQPATQPAPNPNQLVAQIPAR